MTTTNTDLNSNLNFRSDLNSLDPNQQSILVSTIINKPNAFISILDHLPCDIIRSLWLIQFLNLRCSQIKDELNSILIELPKLKKNPVSINVVNVNVNVNVGIGSEFENAGDEGLRRENDLKGMVADLKENKCGQKYSTKVGQGKAGVKLTNYNTLFKRMVTLRHHLYRISNEIIAESKHLSTILSNHQSIIENDLQIMDTLQIHQKVSESNSRNMEAFNKFKLDFLAKTGDLSKANNNIDLGSNIESSREQSLDIKPAINLSTPSESPQPLQSSTIIKIKPTKIKIIKKQQQQPQQQQPIIQPQPKKATPKKEKQASLPPSNIPSREPTPTPPITADDYETEELYCVCRGPSTGRMIACDNPTCKYEWFHYKCVGIYKDPEPNKRWFCSILCETEYWERINRKRALSMSKKRKKRKKKAKTGKVIKRMQY